MSEPRETRRAETSPPSALIFRSIFFVFVLAVVMLEFPGAAELVNGPYSGIHTQNLVVRHVSPEGPNSEADIRRGDTIVAIDGARIRNHVHYLSLVAADSSFAPQRYTFARAGDRVERVVAYTSVPRRLIIDRFAYLIVAFAFLAVGLWVYLRRPDILGSLFAANCAMLAFFLTDRPSLAHPALQLAAELIQDAVILLFPAVLVHFFSVFPVERNARGGSAWARVVTIYAAPAVIFSVSAVVAAARFRFVPVPEPLVVVLLQVSTIYFAAYILASLVIFIRRYRRSGRAQKLRLRVAIAGTIVGFTPFVAVIVVRNLYPEGSSALETASVLCLGFVPVSFAYAILKHGAIELNAVVRKSLVYAFLTGALIAGYYALVESVGDLLTRELGISQIVWMPIAMLVLAALFSPARERVQRLVDRLFYRADYLYRQEVIDFNRAIARKLTRDEILEYLLGRVDDLLKPAFVAVYTNGGGSLLSRYRATGDVPALVEQFSRESFLGRYFSRYRTPLMVEYLDRSWERPNLDLESKQFLSTPGLAVCVPIIAQERFLGLVLLGEKRSGLVYRRADSELLQSFAEQVALVLENAELLESSLEQERLKSEVMLARDIQQSLLPTGPPDTPGVDMLGQMISSFEVGGDYFDYFFIDEHRIAIAIGDVSGKGVPAAMLMSSLQAVFKNLALKGRLAPSEMNAELNAFLFESAKPEQFATFFYGIFDLEDGTFTFSNAGQCPALLVRREFVDRLGEGGLILGAMPDQAYLEGTVRLEADDLLLLYTDGITEQKNAEGAEYGEERLIAFLQMNRNLPPGELQSALVDDVMAFGAGRQDDDITSVIAVKKYA